MIPAARVITPMMMELPSHPRLQRPCLSQVPVTALAFCYQSSARGDGSGGRDDDNDNGALYILAGEDTDLCVYAADDSAARGRPLARIPGVLEEQPIHGIHVQRRWTHDGRTASASRVLVWGAYSLAVLSTEEVVAGQSSSLRRATAPDWIYDAAVSPYDETCAVLVTAHNELIHVDLEAAGGGSLSLGPVTSPSRPILFSAAVAWESAGSVLVAGGTAFGEIIYWRCRVGAATTTTTTPEAVGAGDAQQRCEVLYVLAGHEGSIFGVDISPPLAIHDSRESDSTESLAPLRLLASCSDDRTIRIWDVTNDNNSSSTTTNARGSAHTQSQLSKARETGFGGGSTAWEFARPVEPVAVAMGHISRIWGVRFACETMGPGAAADASVAGLGVYSFGEDATAQRWRLDMETPASEEGGSGEAGPGLRGILVHERTLSLHDGKHIWSHALAYHDDKVLVTTGGADGKISLISDQPIGPETTLKAVPEHRVVTVDMAPAVPAASSQGGREIFGRYTFITADELLAVTSLGRVLLGTFGLEGCLQWEEVKVAPAVACDLRACHVMKRAGQGCAVLGAPSGHLYCYAGGGGIVPVTQFDGKIFDIFPLSGPATSCKSGETDSAEVLVFLHGSVIGHLVSFDAATGTMRSRDQVEGLDARFVAVSAARVADLLFVGSRHGWITILRKEGDGYRSLSQFASPTRDAITAMVPLPKPHDDDEGIAPLYVLATSRDGKYRIYEVVEQTGDANLRVCHEGSPSFGTMIEGAWFTSGPIPELILYGFKSKSFIAWNESRRTELASVACGGAHRRFSLTPPHPSAGPDHLRFAFTKASALCLAAQNQAAHRTVKSGTHGREIRSLSRCGGYLATGAEDTSIRIWECPGVRQGAQGSEMRCVAYLKAHTAGIQGLRWLGDEYLLSSAGNEEFMVWRIKKLRSGYSVLGVVCENVFQDKSAEGDLRIMDFDAAWAGTGTAMTVTLALSNSALKTYSYTALGGFVLLAEGSYTGACLTQARQLHVGDDMCVLTASTDGHISLWQTDPVSEGMRSYKLQWTKMIHQSTVKSLDMLPHEGGWCLLTGGDDNALAATMLDKSAGERSSPRYEVASRAIMRRAHAAAINGVTLLRRGTADLFGVSASNDQKLKLWKLKLSDATTKTTPPAAAVGIEAVASAHSGVADAGDVELVDGGRGVAVGGVGLEMWDFGELGR